MNFLSSSVFWGVVVVMFGLSLLFKAVFNVDIPVFRVVLGLIVVYIGLRVLVGWHGCFYNNSVAFSEARFSPGKSGDYKVMFGKGTIDLRSSSAKAVDGKISVDTIFGESVLLVDESVPMKIEIDAVFAGASIPNGNNMAMGSCIYTTKAYKAGEKYVDVKADVVFGSLRVIGA